MCFFDFISRQIMGIGISCTHPNCKFEGKQCFCYRKELLDALRAYLKKNEKNHQVELKYVNWFYREEYNDEDRVTEMTEDERKTARDFKYNWNVTIHFFYTPGSCLYSKLCFETRKQ